MDTKWKNITNKMVFAVSVLVFAASMAFLLKAQFTENIDAIRGVEYVQSATHEREVSRAFSDLCNALNKAHFAEDARKTKVFDKTLGNVSYNFFCREKGGYSVWNIGEESYASDVLLNFGCCYEWKNGLLAKTKKTNNDFKLNSNLSDDKLDKMVVGFPKGQMKQRERTWKIYCVVTRVVLGLLLLSVVGLLYSTSYRKRKNRLKKNQDEENATSLDVQILFEAGLLLFTWYVNAKGVHLSELLSSKEQISSYASQGAMLFVIWLVLPAMAYRSYREYRFLKSEKKVREHLFFVKVVSDFWNKRESVQKKASKIWISLTGIFTGKAFYMQGLSKAKRKSISYVIFFEGILGLVTLYQLGQGEILFAEILMVIMLAVMLFHFVGTIGTLKDYQVLRQKVDEIYDGDFSRVDLTDKKNMFHQEIQKLNDVGDGFEKNLEEKIRAERTKIELVTNVSHDLKTPLTSIISYIDLLAREENLSPQAREYIAVLSRKSARLKQIITDVFELAKTSSGEIKVVKQELDLDKLLVQTVTDLQDKIDSTGMTLRLSLPQEPVMVLTDGNRMYRVLQNIIDNALKYSLQGTRVYLSLEAANNKACICLKNTASYEMKFTKEDVLERFYRGDASRGTEGNGLGLSIAQGFTMACGGSFDVEIDGDQFKVFIEFPIVVHEEDAGTDSSSSEME